MNPIDKESDHSRESLEAENARLRAKVRELESRHSDKRTGESDKSGRRRRREETRDRVRDIPSHAVDEMDRLARGLTYAFVEHLQAGADVMNVVADEIFGPTGKRRRQGDEEEERSDRALDLVTDVASGVAEGLHKSLDIPRRAANRFFDLYFDEEDKPRRSHEGESSHRRRETRGDRERAREGTTETVTTSPAGSKTG